MNFESNKNKKMAKFIKDGLQSKSEKELQIEVSNDDILSPTITHRQKIRCVNGKLQKCLARQFKQSLTGLLLAKFLHSGLVKFQFTPVNFLFILPETIVIF